MYTFSQLVDELVAEVRRPDLLVDIARYLNQTIRECHFHPETNAVQFFVDNRRETTILSAGETVHTWNLPRPANFQKIEAVNYPTVFDSRGETIWPAETSPGRHLSQMTQYFYRAGSTVVFAGLTGVGTPINIAWFEFPSSLIYMNQTCRPMSYNDIGGKVYSVDWAHEHAREDADSLTTNWLLERWHTVVMEGVRAKLYKRVSDTERARTSYSLYAQLRKGLATSEVAVFF